MPAHLHASRLPWSDLRLSVPNTRNSEAIVSFVECTLVELTHEDVGAEYISSNVWGMKRTQFIVADDVGEQFQKRHYGDRLGWHESTVPRRTVRDELITHLTRSPSASADQSGEGAASEPDTFVVKPVRELRTP
ncbi:hypothetical protein PNP03_03610 [Halobacterium salinarum]|nr:hypothetical protein [Halobacterium salinarum]MDL0121790.1 hypothetical protein [Halobacterium salinarum]